MLRLTRLFAYPTLAYFMFRAAYPDASAPLYHMITLPLLWGAAAAFAVGLKVLDQLGAGRRRALEAAWAALILLYLGTTWPVRGKRPIERVLGGDLPTQSDLRRGTERLGLDPHAFPLSAVIDLFPG